MMENTVKLHDGAPTTVQKRLAYIDMAKAFSLFLVILFHRQGIKQTTLQLFGAAFHMPIFFFLFGLASSGGTKSEKLFPLLLRRFKTLYVPYLLWNAIYVRILNLKLKQYLLILWGSHSAITDAGSNSVLWFLPTIFAAAVIFDIVTYLTNKHIPPSRGQVVCHIIITIVAAIASQAMRKVKLEYAWTCGLDIALNGFIFIMTGHLLKSTFKKMVQFPRLILLLIAAVFCGVTLYVSIKNGNRLVMAVRIYGKYLLFLAAGITGSIGITVLMLLVEKTIGFIAKPIAWIGKHSMFIFASHYIAFSIINQIFSRYAISLNESLLEQTLYSMLTIALCSIACAFVSKFIPVLEGK